MKDSAGNELHNEIVQCPYCQMDTAGNHYSDCPFWINKITDSSVGILTTEEYKVKMKFIIVEEEK